MTKSIVKEEEVKNNELSKGKVAIEQTNQESHKAHTCVSGTKSEQYNTYDTHCAPKHHRWLRVCPIAPTPQVPSRPALIRSYLLVL